MPGDPLFSVSEMRSAARAHAQAAEPIRSEESWCGLRCGHAWTAVSSSEVNTRRNSMSNNTGGTARNGRTTRLSTETKAAFKTTEFIVYVIILIGMFIAAAVTDNGDDGQGFGADQVWLYATILTVGYMIARGLAKSGSREYYDNDDHTDHDHR
jgi:hypothetical protein